MLIICSKIIREKYFRNMLDINKKECIFAPAFDGEERVDREGVGGEFFERIEAKVWKVRYKKSKIHLQFRTGNKNTDEDESSGA